MRYYLFLLNLYFGFVLSFMKQNDDMEMITDVIKSYETPTSVVVKVCWSSAIKVTFMKRLLNMEISKVVNFVNDDDNGLKYLVPAKDDLFVIDMNCKSSKTFLTQAHTNKKFRKPYRWLILETTNNENFNISPEFADFDIFVDSEVLVARKTNDNEFTISSIYKIESKSTWCTEHFGTWTNIKGLNRSKGMDISSTIRRKNLSGLTVVISTIINDNETKNLLEDLTYSNIFVDTPTKVSFRIMKPLYHFMNATIHVIYTDKWGYNTNGTWNGMLGHLNSGTAELGGVTTFVTKERLEILNYLIYPTPYKVTFVFRSPPLSYQNNLFLLPFKPVVWYCIGAFAFLLIGILYINAKWEKQKQSIYEKEKDDTTALRPDLSDISVLVVSAISQQGSNKELKGTLGRLVVFILYLTFLFLYTSYSANIVALLQSTSNQIKTLNDLLNSKLEIGAEDVVYNRYYFETATNPVRKAIYETKILTKGPNQNFMSLEEGVKKLQTKPFAFHMNAVIGYKVVEKYFHEHEKCGLQEIEYLQLGKPLLCCRKNTPFAEIYKIGFFRIQEHGLNDRENRLVYTKKPVCTGGGGSFGSVNMIDFYPVLLMLIYGSIAAIFILIVELVIHRKQAEKF